MMAFKASHAHPIYQMMSQELMMYRLQWAHKRLQLSSECFIVVLNKVHFLNIIYYNCCGLSTI